MENIVQIRTVEDMSLSNVYSDNIRKEINCIELDQELINGRFAQPLFLNAAIAILVLSGNCFLTVNYRTRKVNTNSLIILSASHLFSFRECSNDFRCLSLMVSKEFMNEMDSTDMIYRRIKYGVKLYNTPVMQLDHSQMRLLAERISAINGAIDNTKHLYHKEMILNQLFTFYLDLSNIIDRQTGYCSEGNLTRYESIIKAFIELLADNYRKEHKVEFYSSRLNISAHYLTLIVKRVTGQSICDFIYEMLYSEARNLLSHSKLSIQEITARLNFSDQSAFGKFFKRKAGLSPGDYRKK